MTDFTFGILVENSGLLGGWAQVIEQFPELIPAFAKHIVDDHEANIVDYLAQTPGEPVSPWIWATPAQKIAYLMTDGFGAGIPHRRGGADSMEENWNVDVSFPGDEVLAQIEVSNSAVNSEGRPYVNFVQGWRQQPGFEATGWLGPEAITDFLLDEENAMVDDYRALTVDALTNWRATD